MPAKTKENVNIYCQTSIDFLVKYMNELNSTIRWSVDYEASAKKFKDQLPGVYDEAIAAFCRNHHSKVDININSHTQAYLTASTVDPESLIFGVIAVDLDGTYNQNVTILLETAKQAYLKAGEWIVKEEREGYEILKSLGAFD